MNSIPSNIKNLTKISGPKGSNPGGVYQDDKGTKFYVKESKSRDHARAEVLASKLYKLAGAPVIECHLVSLDYGATGTISVWQEVVCPFNRKNQPDIAAARQWFPVHAWLANYDAIGLEYDNQIWVGNTLTTVDVGGSLMYRAMGGLKEDFGGTCHEWVGMRHNQYPSGKVFGGTMLHSLALCAMSVALVKDDDILITCQDSGVPNWAALAQTLIARKYSLLKQAVG